MNAVVPHRFLFRYSFPLRHIPELPREGRALLKLPEDCLLPDIGDLEDARAVGQLAMAWNLQGLGVCLTVSGKKRPLFCEVDEPTESDGLQLWVDTRNTQSIHRASRFCHRFCLLPSGAGPKADKPHAVQLPIPQAREDAPVAKAELIRVAARVHKTGYTLETWLPSEVLNGFDPEANPSLGFYYAVRDAELGEQFLSVGRAFPFAQDPSLWATLELVE